MNIRTPLRIPSDDLRLIRSHPQKRRVPSDQELEKFYGKHRSYTVVKKDGGVFGSSKCVDIVSNGDTRTFDALSKAVE